MKVVTIKLPKWISSIILKFMRKSKMIKLKSLLTEVGF